MIEVVCQDCYGKILYSEDSVKRGIADGSIIEGELRYQQQVGSGPTDTRDIYVRTLLYICKTCQGVARTKARVTGVSPQGRAQSIEDESAEIQRILAHVRSMHSEWTLEDCAHEAVERFNDPARIKDAGFRHYLMSVHAEGPK